MIFYISKFSKLSAAAFDVATVIGMRLQVMQFGML